MIKINGTNTWSSSDTNATVKPIHRQMRMHCQHYRMQMHCQMQMHDHAVWSTEFQRVKFLWSTQCVISLARQSAGWAQGHLDHQKLRNNIHSKVETQSMRTCLVNFARLTINAFAFDNADNAFAFDNALA